MTLNEMYFKNENGRVCKFKIEYDDEPWNPRYDMDGNIGHIMAWWGRYGRDKYGDYKENTYRGPDDCLNALVEANVPHISDVEVITIKEKIEILEKHDFIFLNLFAYEHSGITMSCSYTYPYTDRWDGGWAGFVYTTKNELFHVLGREENEWKEIAKEILTGEVELYDQYLRGECYGYIVEEKVHWTSEDDDEMDTWEHLESCWGYYSDKFGDELLYEIAVDYGLKKEELFHDEITKG